MSHQDEQTIPRRKATVSLDNKTLKRSFTVHFQSYPLDLAEKEQLAIATAVFGNYDSTYILLHEWDGSTGEYSVRGWQYWPTVGRANTEAENRVFSCTARPKECDNIFII